MLQNGVLTSPTLLRQILSPENREEAWRTFLERYLPLIHNWCRRAGLNATDADEVSARVVGKLVVALRTFVYDPAHRFRGWLKTVVENQVRDFRRQWLSHPDHASGHPDIHRLLDRIEAPAALEDLVDSLDKRFQQDWQLAQEVVERVKRRVLPHNWEAFWRTVVEQKQPADVARSLGISIGAVYVAKMRVAKMVQQEGAKLRSQGPTRNGDRP